MTEIIPTYLILHGDRVSLRGDRVNLRGDHKQFGFCYERRAPRMRPVARGLYPGG